MRSFVQRRVRNVGALMVALAGIWLLVRAQERNLGASAFTTGYLLLAAVLFLALYNVRKRLPFLPLGSSAAWLQWHLYVGLGTVGVFALHIGTRWPSGVLDTALAVVYAFTVTSGVVGLYFTRTIPAQLARVGEEVVFERIPAFQRHVCQQAGGVVLGAVTASGTTTLADFYVQRMYAFFERRRGLSYLLWPTTTRRKSLMQEMQDLRRYLSDQEQGACEKLFGLVRRKDDLDFQEARQRLLKSWLFVHIGLTYALVMLALLHGLLAHAFAGGGA
ncbi:MAG: hypothetical protein WD468_10925 [Pirellulales bacterium]